MRVKSFFTRLLGALAAALAMASAMAQTPADVLKPGTVFHLEGDNRISGTKTQFVVLISSVGPQVNGTRTDAGQAPRDIKDILRDVQAPVAIGKTWSQDYQFQREWRGQWSNYQYDGKATVAAEETLTIAGQPVKTMRIDYKGWINRIGGGQVYSWEYAQTRWYAPELGYVVKYVGTETDKGKKIFDYTSVVTKIDLPAGANPAAAPATTTPIAAAATAVPAKQ